MKYGRIGAVRPLSAKWGLDRGTPIDRYYVNDFLMRHRSDVKGRVLEVKHDDFASRIGGKNVDRLDIVSLEADNPNATIVGDIADPDTLPKATFDCVILTQTLHLIFDMAIALENLRLSLRPGGVALITVPGITPILTDATFPWYWSLTEQALRRLLMQQFDEEQIELQTYGNLFSATAFLHAAAVEEVTLRKLDRRDPSYPVTIAARVAV